MGNKIQLNFSILAKRKLYHLKTKRYANRNCNHRRSSEFKLELLKEIKLLFAAHHGQPTKKWLKSYEVRKLLGISPGTLQNMRINGTLAFTKIGGVIFYDSEEIQKMMVENRVNNRFDLGRKK